MKQDISQKKQSSLLKIVFNIWSYAAAATIATLFIWRFIVWFLVGAIGEILATIVNAVVLIIILIFAMRIAVKTVLAKTVILKKDITKVSIGVALIFVVGQILLSVYYLRSDSMGLTKIINFITTDIGVFFIVYLWLKRLVKTNDITA